MGACLARLMRPSYGSCAPANPRADDINTPIGDGREAPKHNKSYWMSGTGHAAAG